jgi:hypothetical protein
MFIATTPQTSKITSGTVNQHTPDSNYMGKFANVLVWVAQQLVELGACHILERAVHVDARHSGNVLRPFLLVHEVRKRSMSDETEAVVQFKQLHLPVA